MKHRLTPKDLIERDDFQLLAEVDHLHIKQFIFEQIAREKELIRLYSIYQISMVALFVFILVKSIVLNARGISQPVLAIAGAVLFAFTVLIVLHELIHAGAFFLRGTGKVQFGAIWSKFIFYAGVDQKVIDESTFRFVALAPFWVVKAICVLGAVFFWSGPLAYFFVGLMCLHSLFCAGDVAMLAFYKLHPDKEIYNYDDLAQRKTFFYFRKNRAS
mgnify:CR=1 FL=1